MSRLLTAACLLTPIVLLNITSGAFLVIGGFTRWDITATVTAFILSACIVHIEATNKWKCIGKASSTTTLFIYGFLSGASALFWFSYIIYKTANFKKYQGGYLDLLKLLPTKLVALVISLYLIRRAYRTYYTHLTSESLTTCGIDGDAIPLAAMYSSANSNLAIQ